MGFTEDGSVRAGGDRETSLEPQVEFRDAEGGVQGLAQEEMSGA